MNEKVREFLRELEDLTHKYGLEIGGCHCCGSPWIKEIDIKTIIGNKNYYISENNDQLIFTDKEDKDRFYPRHKGVDDD